VKQAPPFVKVCGLRSHAEAAFAVGSGTDAIGINLYPKSKRYVALDQSAPWLEILAGQVLRVAVVVDPTAEELKKIRQSAVVDAVQFHGDEEPAFCEDSGFDTWIRAVRVRDEATLESSLSYQASFLLLDSWSPGVHGGTGKRLSWELARSFVAQNSDRKILLAGGLNPSNVQEALRIVSPYGVDAASGLELETGRKEDYLVREFIQQAKSRPTSG